MLKSWKRAFILCIHHNTDKITHINKEQFTCTLSGDNIRIIFKSGYLGTMYFYINRFNNFIGTYCSITSFTNNI